ncbi:hypothetical protein N7478_000057 [Penicillium angulare]|uniref:uncharacterized protein n=1 Tax=Penicillium angulare TaxID=116970 RepID=UPI00254193A1|nr:uncharacterized protein N7478_000057 [Penicillium angulare]KAJ5290806.1 hypothetical protein N7478_000057 [Penicillium angulare]
MRHVKTDIPYAWFWHGKPLRKGHERGEHIVPVQLVSQNHDLQDHSYHSSTDPSPMKKPNHPQRKCGCGCESYEQRPPSPPITTVFDNNPAQSNYLGCGSYTCVDCETNLPPSVKRFSCNACITPPPPPPTATFSHEYMAPMPTPRSSRTTTPAEHCNNECAASSSRTVYCLSCLDYHHECQYLAAVPMSSGQQPVEALPSRAAPTADPMHGFAPHNKMTQVKCTCPSCMAASVPEVENRHQGCCHSEDSRFQKHVAPTVSEGTASLASVDLAGNCTRC